MKRSLLLVGLVVLLVGQLPASAGAISAPRSAVDYQYRVVKGACTQVWRFPSAQDATVQQFSDIDHDGRPEVLVSVLGNSGGTRLEVRAGSNGRLRYAIPVALARYSMTTVLGDLNGDGIADIAVHPEPLSGGSTSQRDSNTRVGRVASGPAQLRVFSGANGRQLWAVKAPRGETDFGVSVSQGRDYDRDGVPDLVVGAADIRQLNGPGTGRVYVLSGRTGRVLKVISGPRGSSWSFGDRVAVVPGQSMVIVGDDFGDNFHGRVYAIDTAARNPIVKWRAGAADASELLFGAPLLSAGDLNGDGTPDVVVGIHNYADGNGRIVALNGRTGSRIWISEARRAGEHFGLSLAVAGDLNRDRTPEVLFGAPTADPPNAVLEQGGRFGALDGRTGRPVVDVESFTQRRNQVSDDLGWSVTQLDGHRMPTRSASRYVVTAPRTVSRDGAVSSVVTAFDCRTS